MSDEKKSVLVENLTVLSQPDNFQKYILGTKRNGQPRAVYDVIKDYTRPKKKKKKKDKYEQPNSYSWMLTAKKKKKKIGKKKKDKYWHI